MAPIVQLPPPIVTAKPPPPVVAAQPSSRPTDVIPAAPARRPGAGIWTSGLARWLWMGAGTLLGSGVAALVAFAIAVPETAMPAQGQESNQVAPSLAEATIESPIPVAGAEPAEAPVEEAPSSAGAPEAAVAGGAETSDSPSKPARTKRKAKATRRPTVTKKTSPIKPAATSDGTKSKPLSRKAFVHSRLPD